MTLLWLHHEIRLYKKWCAYLKWPVEQPVFSEWSWSKYPLRSLQMFGINLPQWTVTLSFLVIVLSFLMLFKNVSLDKPMRVITAYSRPEAFFYIQNREPIKDSDVQVGDTVLVKEPKLDKFCTPYHPVPLTVTSKNHSILTAEGSDRKVTRNYSYFKKLFLDTQFPLSVMLWKKRKVTKMFHTHSYILYHLVKTMSNPASEDINSRASAQAEPLLRRSARVPKPPKNLIHTIGPCSLFV